ncbi:RidA family protein [Inquilinus limosus]|uniref:RidA family protein n=1 Tax=Inquilinus limosus TaxID=171674 RepID=UPI000688F44C|nr:RidA family protein [Inquilinus limosus]
MIGRPDGAGRAGTGGLVTLQPEGWPAPKGYANGVMGRGPVVFVGGQIGWDAEGRFADGLVEQVAQALRNILAVLAEAGAGPQHIARLTWYVTDMEAYRASLKPLGRAYREVMGAHYPAMAVMRVVELVEPAALVEIEATAVLPE